MRSLTSLKKWKDKDFKRSHFWKKVLKFAMNLLFSLILIYKAIQKNNAFIAKIRKSQNQLFKAFLKLETESKSS